MDDYICHTANFIKVLQTIHKLDFYILFAIVNAPTLKELQRHITPQYAADWREIGVELGLTDAKLREIEANNPCDVKQCCNRMFSEWLRLDTNASWEELLAAIESPAVSAIGTVVEIYM